jgi:uncharacterized membrane protein
MTLALLTSLQVEGGTSDAMEYTQYVLRWLHVWFGVIWIGHLYFFNFVNANTMPKLDGPTKKLVVPQLMPRALFWFRWGAAVTWITGVTMFTLLYMMGPKYFWDGGNSANPISGRGWWILTGFVFGTVMAFNVWFIIWPNQKQIIAATRDGKAAEAPIPELVKKATLASKINTYLSVPLLAIMVSQHFTLILANPAVSIPVTCLVSWALVWHWYKVAPKVPGM